MMTFPRKIGALVSVAWNTMNLPVKIATSFTTFGVVKHAAEHYGPEYLSETTIQTAKSTTEFVSQGTSNVTSYFIDRGLNAAGELGTSVVNTITPVVLQHVDRHLETTLPNLLETLEPTLVKAAEVSAEKITHLGIEAAKAAVVGAKNAAYEKVSETIEHPEKLYGEGAPANSKGLAEAVVEFVNAKFSEIDTDFAMQVTGGVAALAILGAVTYIAYNRYKASAMVGEAQKTATVSRYADPFN